MTHRRRPTRRPSRRTAGGEVVCFSGCDDSQTSADTSSLAADNANTGALTFAFINAIESTIGAGRPCTYASILSSIKGTLGQVAGPGAAGAPTRQKFGGASLLGGMAMNYLLPALVQSAGGGAGAGGAGGAGGAD